MDATQNWADANNWSGDAVPTASDDVTINSNVTVNIAATTTIRSLVLGNSGGSTTPTLNFSYDAITNGALTITGGDLTVYSGAIVTHSAGTTVVVGTVFIDITSGNALIQGSINVSAKGYKNGAGTGVGGGNGSMGAHGGGGHGGTGAGSPSFAGGASYGSLTQPVTLGSGGGQQGDSYAAGKGGGAVKLTASGTITITGTVNANGGNYGTTSLESIEVVLAEAFILLQIP